MLFIGDELNRHVGTSRCEFDSVHECFGFKKRNESGNSILDLLCLKI